jgi:hypothetical protein
MKGDTQMAHHYHPLESAAMAVPTPLRGRYLSRSLRDNKRKADFTAADLYRGTTQLVEPSLAQAALITGSDVTAVWWALQRGEALILEYRWYGRVWCLSGGRHITDEIAQLVIKNANVTSVGDALFSDVPAQTWRWIES